MFRKMTHIDGKSLGRLMASGRQLCLVHDDEKSLGRLMTIGRQLSGRPFWSLHSSFPGKGITAVFQIRKFQ